MGAFSWMFANKDNKERLRIGKPGYLLIPEEFQKNGKKAYKAERYDGYGEFESVDAYDMVAIWNRKWVSEHPKEKMQVDSYSKEFVTLDTMEWYPFYADLSLDEQTLVKLLERMQGKTGAKYSISFPELRCIGIDLSFGKINGLPFPIKVSSAVRGVSYKELPASQDDPDQGC